MTQIKTVTVAGVTGTVGPSIVNELAAAGFDVQIFTRKGSSGKSFAGARIVEVDYEDSAELQKALRSQDAVVSALGATAMEAQKALIDASVAAGVKRFIPSEYGSNLNNDRVRGFPTFGGKVEHQSILSKAAASSPSFTYTLIYNGPFLDWGISIVPFIINVGGKSAEVFDGGDTPFSTSRLSTVGKAVAGTLKQFDATKNRAVFVHDAVITQNQLISRAEKYTGSKFTGTPVNTDNLEKEAWGLVKDPSANPMAWIYSFIKISIWARGCNCEWRKTDNELLGIQELRGAELDRVLDEEIAKAVQN